MDIVSPRVLYIKAALFLLLGVAAAGLLLAQSPRLSVLALLAIAVWAFARAYYFAFYVIEQYVDGSYRFAGLGPFLLYVLRARRKPPDESGP